MNIFTIVSIAFLLITTSYEAENNITKSSDPSGTILPRKAGFRFEDDIDFSNQNDNSHIAFEDPSDIPFKFDEPLDQKEISGHVTFQDNKIDDNGHKKKRRRRRRKPRYQLQGYPGGLVPGQYPGGPPPGPYTAGPLPGQYPGYPGQPVPGQGSPDQAYPGGPGYGPIRPYRPRPKPSFASEALSTVTGALTSIALYDDYQCVPRLLCEAAGGGALGTSNVLQSVAGLQPLLTLLSAYSGISTSPLFIFGRAVFLGMTSKGNTGSCRYAYPQCPTDPEQLVHYLNNHNGGFFRFFSAPQQQIPQNLEQFYNQLSGYGLQQNYGLYDPQNPGAYNPQLNQDRPNPQQPQDPQNQYGFYNNPQLNPNQQQIVPQDPQNSKYGLYNPQNQDPQQYGLYPQANYLYHGPQFVAQNQGNPQQSGPYQPTVQNYGFYNPQYYQIPQFSSPNSYNQYYGPQNPYASKFGYGYNKKQYKTNKEKYNLGTINYKSNGVEKNKIEKRIQNTPNYAYVDDDKETFKWIFPQNYKTDNKINNNYVIGGKNIKFPDENTSVDNVVNESNNRKAKSIIFPESQNSKYVNYYDYPSVNNVNSGIHYQNYYAGISNQNNNYGIHVNDNNKYISNVDFDVNDEIQTVYIVRDDPNNPEIVKVRRGQKIQ